MIAQPNVLASSTLVDMKPSRGGLLAQLDAQLGSDSSARSESASKVYASLPLRRSGTSVKLEPTDLIIPRKSIPSSLLFLGAENEEDKPTVPTPPVSKRTSWQPPKPPLALVNAKAETSQGHDHVPPPHHQVVLPVFASHPLF